MKLSAICDTIVLSVFWPVEHGEGPAASAMQSHAEAVAAILVGDQRYDGGGGSLIDLWSRSDLSLCSFHSVRVEAVVHACCHRLHRRLIIYLPPSDLCILLCLLHLSVGGVVPALYDLFHSHLLCCLHACLFLLCTFLLCLLISAVPVPVSPSCLSSTMTVAMVPSHCCSLPIVFSCSHCHFCFYIPNSATVHSFRMEAIISVVELGGGRLICLASSATFSVFVLFYLVLLLERRRGCYSHSPCCLFCYYRHFSHSVHAL